jgi:hypothetical protein
VNEAQLHGAVAAFLFRAIRPPVCWTTFPAGGGGKVRGRLLKARGLKPGWPDLLVIAPGPIVAGIELKAGKNGQSPEQKSVESDFHGCRCMYYVARTVDEVEGFLRGVGIPLHATAFGLGTRAA